MAASTALGSRLAALGAGIALASRRRMAVALEYAEPSSFVVHASGDVTFDECIRAEASLLSHPELDAHSQVLVDGRGVQSAPTATELRVIARELKPLRDRGIAHMAIVAGSDFVYGVARMFGVFAHAWGLDVRTFRDMRAAKNWLADADAR